MTSIQTAAIFIGTLIIVLALVLVVYLGLVIGIPVLRVQASPDAHAVPSAEAGLCDASDVSDTNSAANYEEKREADPDEDDLPVVVYEMAEDFESRFIENGDIAINWLETLPAIVCEVCE